MTLPAYAVTDQDGSVTGPDGYDDTAYTYSVSGPGGDDFVFDGGILSFKPGHEPDFEDQSSYSITLVAYSGEGSRRLSTTLDVTIEVVDGEDVGAVVLSQRQPEVGHRDTRHGQRRRRRRDHQEVGVGAVRGGYGEREGRALGRVHGRP